MLEVIDLTPPTGTAERLHETSTRSVVRVDGLVGLPGVRGEPWDRPEEDGAVNPAAQYLPAKTITVEGEIWGTSIPSAFSEWRRLTAAFYNCRNTPGNLTFTEYGSGLALQVGVVYAGGAETVVQGGAPILAYQVMFRAADPVLYSQNEQNSAPATVSSGGGIPFPIPFPIPFGAGTSGGTVTVTNSGNANTWPRFVLTGPVTNPAISNVTRGETLTFIGLALSASQTLIVETKPTRYALVGTTNVQGAIRWSDSRWPKLSPGANTIQFTGGGTSGATNLVTYWRDGYL